MWSQWTAASPGLTPSRPIEDVFQIQSLRSHSEVVWPACGHSCPRPPTRLTSYVYVHTKHTAFHLVHCTLLCVEALLPAKVSSMCCFFPCTEHCQFLRVRLYQPVRSTSSITMSYLSTFSSCLNTLFQLVWQFTWIHEINVSWHSVCQYLWIQ